MLCQILNRASSQDGCFHHITTLEMPGLENVEHLPILTATCGILLAILKEDMENFKDGNLFIFSHFCVKSYIISNTYCHLFLFSSSFLKCHCSQSLQNTTGGAKFPIILIYISPGGEPSLIFTKLLWVNYIDLVWLFPVFCGFICFLLVPDKEHIKPEEMAKVNKMLAMLTHYHSIVSDTHAVSVDEDEMCTICFAFPISTIFEPCKHHSCRWVPVIWWHEKIILTTVLTPGFLQCTELVSPIIWWTAKTAFSVKLK